MVVGVFALVAAGGSAGCSSNGAAARDAAGGRDTGTELHDAGSDAGGAAGNAGHDGGTHDAAGTEGGGCVAWSPASDPPVAATRCAGTAEPLVPSLCAGATSCPVTAYYRLTATGESYYPTLAPVGTDAASVMLTATAGTDLYGCLYTMAAGATPEVQEWPSTAPLPLLTSVGGARTIIASNGELGLLQESGSGWSFGVVTAVPETSDYVASLGRPDGELFVTFYDGQAEHAGLAHLRDGCAQVTTLPGITRNFYGLDVDGAGNPWVAGISADPTTGATALVLVGPDGTAYYPPTPGPDTPQEPIVLAGGVSGAVHFPTLVTRDFYGVHLLQATGSTPLWTDTVVPGSPEAAFTGACPPQQQPTPTGGCGAIPATCSLGLDGPESGYAAVRTASGKTFVAWWEVKNAVTSYAVTCTSAAQGALCECTTTETSSQGGNAVAIARVDTASPGVVLRLTDTATNAETIASELVMIARGDTLLLAANKGLATGGGTDLLYFEIDTTDL